ncbi:hypothetical protein DJ90_5235 [Paenibacillus macerans]|uniref:Uncharacterized protein n=1 Tax=Paenibacillus macerans TaxID=44252 RepID=A0A090XU80_PAEMA|nr:hypothetical protein DJ90_5235 [Paenibacillus macerans]
MGGRGGANPKGGGAVSILELCLKLLDGVSRLVGVLTGISTLLTARKQAREKKPPGIGCPQGL